MTSSDAPADTIGVLFFGYAMFAAVDWLYSRIPVRFPDLKICLGHAGGYTAFGVARMDKGWRAGAMEDMPEFEDARSYLQKAPSEYLGRFYYDTVTHHPKVMRHLIDFVGADRIVLGSDYNQDMSCERPVEFVRSVPGLTPARRSSSLLIL